MLWMLLQSQTAVMLRMGLAVFKFWHFLLKCPAPLAVLLDNTNSSNAKHGSCGLHTSALLAVLLDNTNNVDTEHGSACSVTRQHTTL